MIRGIANAQVLLPEGFARGGIRFAGERIDSVSTAEDGPDMFDARGLMAVPGFVDLHVHGGGGACVMSGRAQEVVRMANAHARFGTTTILPTAWTAPVAAIRQAVEAVRDARSMPCDATIAGIFLEGPFLSPAQAGAQKPEDLLLPSVQAWRAMTGGTDVVRMVGMAPELPGALELAQTLARQGLVVSVAHSDADEEQMRQAAEHGFSDVTHLYSGCSTFTRRGGFRVPGVVESALVMDDMTVQVIGDLKHLPTTMVQLTYRCKGPERMYLVTDGLELSATDVPEGTVCRQANGVMAVCEDGVMKLMNRQAFAGSVATMDRVVRGAVASGIPLRDALRMASATPAKRIGLGGVKGSLTPGYDADVVLLDDRLTVAACFSRGRLIFSQWERNVSC